MPSRRKSGRRLKQASPVAPGFAAPLAMIDWRDRFNTAVLISLIVHTILIFGITFKAANPALFRNEKPLDVVLVNAKSQSKPLKADVLAQNNLDGGGDVEEDMQASTPLPADEADSVATLSSLNRKIKEQEVKVRELMTQAQAKYSVDTAKPANKPEPQPPAPAPAPNPDLVASSLEMARLQARISDEYNAYQKRPRRVFIGTRAQEYVYARYVEDWRLKIERIGNLNYPEAAKRDHIYGALVLSVSIKSDGSLEDVQVDRSSGSKVLDAAAVKIVEMSAPFAPFTPEMRKTVDVLSITRVWNFTNSDRLSASGQ